MELVYLIVGIVVGFVVAIVLSRISLKNKLLQADKQYEANIQELSQQHAESDTQFEILKSRHLDQEKALEQMSQKYHAATAKQQELDKLVLEKELSMNHLRERLEKEQKQLEALQEKFKIEFENIANRILKQSTLDFSESSGKKMGDILNPLKEKIQEFEKKVDETYEKGLKDRSDLKAEVKKLYELSVSLDKDARDLTKALKSDSKKQGNWGEVILERVLERSGLTKDQEYITQYTGRNDEGDLLRPDVLIKLPENKHLIIDSKVSLTAYTEYVSSEDELLQTKALKRHLESIKQHVKELSSKKYDTLEGLNSPDLVLLFMPIEPAFGLAVQVDAELFGYAWSQGVVIVSPTTLLATLRTVASIWKYEKQNQNAMEIADRGGRLYDKFESFVKDLETIGVHLDRTSRVYQEAHKKLRSGSGNLLRQVEQLKTMGVPTKKSLPPQYLEDHGA